jgi:uracil-DNA glycosylase
MGIDEDTFYDGARIAIVPMGFCFPGHTAKRADLPPPKDCARLWRVPLFDALPNVRLILAIGKAAQDWHIGGRMRLHERVRTWTENDGETDGIEVIPLPHPSWRNNAWLKANSWFDTETLPRMRARLAAHLPPSSS